MRWLRMATTVPDTGPHDRLEPDWYRRKIAQVQQKMKERKLNAMLLLDATNIIYTTGYFHLSTERPIAALIPESGDPVLFIPELEVDQVQLWWVKDYESYFDFPGPVNRVRWIFERVAKRGLASWPDWRRGAKTGPYASNKAGRAASRDRRRGRPDRRVALGQG